MSLNNLKIFIAIPNTGNMRAELCEWLLAQKQVIIYMPQLRPLDYSMNVIVDEFLKTDCKWLFKIDSDIVPPLDVLNMTKNNVPVCSAHASTVHDGETIPVGMTRNNDGYHHDFKHSKPGLHKVDAVGGGCVLIRRDVFDNLERPYFRYVYDHNGYLKKSEDFDFSERVGDVYFDARYRCKHFTTIGI